MSADNQAREARSVYAQGRTGEDLSTWHYLDCEMTAPELNMENRFLRSRILALQDMLYELEKQAPVDAMDIDRCLAYIIETFQITSEGQTDLIQRFLARQRSVDEDR